MATVSLLAATELHTLDKVALVVVVAGLALLLHALAYHAAEGALRTNRWLFRRGADLLTVAAAYLAVRLFL